MDMKYRRKRFTNKLEYGIWTFDRRGPKGSPRIFARCSKCGQVNDMTGGVFMAEYNNGVCKSAKSGCAACKFCGRAFNEWVFERWVPSLTYVSPYPFGEKSPSEIAKAVSGFKGSGVVYFWGSTLAISTFSPNTTLRGRSGQVDYRDGFWIASTNNQLRRQFKNFNEAMTALVEYLNGGSFVPQTPATAAV